MGVEGEREPVGDPLRMPAYPAAGHLNERLRLVGWACLNGLPADDTKPDVSGGIATYAA